MNAAIVRVPPSEIVPTPVAPTSPPPPPSGPRGRPFASVYADVMQRSDDMLPDQVVHVADLRMTPEGQIELPDGLRYRMNDWARKNLGSMLGARDRWFQNASGEERAEEVNRRFSRTPGEKKIRAWRDSTGEANGILRTFLAPSFTPIDDSRIFAKMAALMRGLLDEYLFTSVQFTDTTTHYTAVHVEGLDMHGDVLHPGWHLRNSEVGAAALTLDDHFWRLACSNGLLVRVGGKRALYRTHRQIDDDQLAAAFVIAIGRLPERWKVSFGQMHAAKLASVPHPDTAIAVVLDSPEVPKTLVEEAQRLVLRDGDATRYGVVQAMTYVAHTLNKDPDVRFAIERLAGDYLAATSALAVA